MGYASKSGRAKTNSKNPEAFGVCMRCGIWYNRNQLRNQMEWRGATLLPLYIFVCNPCYDTPQENLRAIVVPADPIPVQLALTESFIQDESSFRVISELSTIDPATGIPIPGDTILDAEDGQHMNIMSVGNPLGLEQNAIMSLKGNIHYGVELPILSVISNGTPIITATCYSPHGLVNNNQISADGLAVAKACGFYSITVISATTFTWQTNVSISSASLLQPHSRIVTASVGLPLGFEQIPQTGM